MINWLLSNKPQKCIYACARVKVVKHMGQACCGAGEALRSTVITDGTANPVNALL